MAQRRGERVVRLVVFRHGIAIDRADPECPEDRLRPLTRRGVERTSAAARGLGRLGVEPGLILASPYVRTEQTARLAAHELDVSDKRVLLTDELQPGARPQDVLRLVWESGSSSVLCVGHAPDVDLIVSAALGLGSRTLTRLKKAGAAAVSIESLTGPDAGFLDWVMSPRALRRIAGS